MNFRSTFRLRQLTLAVAMGLSLTGGVAYAQQTAGDIVGSATYAAGETVVIKNADSGLTRSISVTQDGKFRFPSLPSGRYEVQLQQDGRTLATSSVTVVAGQTAQVNLGAEQSATSLSSVTVTANAIPAIDVSSVESRTTFSAQQLNQLPVPRDAVSVALLAPGVVKGNAIFGNLPSFNGSSVAENSYYVDGFNVTNLYNNLSFGQVPFQAIDQLDVQAGGYGAQYGFSTGGVTTVNIKRGTNEWKGGVSWTTAPNWARETQPTVRRANGTVFRDYSKNSSNSNTYTAWLGGPLIKDKLFIFALGEFTKGTSTTYSSSSTSGSTNRFTNGTSSDLTSKSPYWVVKLDWNITDNHHLEYTGFDNTDKNKYNYYSAGYDTDGKPYRGTYNGDLNTKFGGLTNVLKYTGYLTDDLTLTAQYGVMKSNNSTYTVGANGVPTRYSGDVNAQDQGCPYVAYAGNPWGPRGCWIVSSFDLYGGQDERKAGRIDLEWKLGDHSLKGGYSDERWTSDAGTAYSGGHYYYYYTAPTANNPGLVFDTIFKTGGKVKVDQKSWYLEDNWQITDKFLFYAGIRNDNFNNKNGAGETFVKQDNIWQPRLGFSWDLLGDQSLKLFGTAGRYSLPMAANVALRAATASYFVEYDSLYSGINPDGSPIIVGERGGEGYYVSNGEDGSTPDPKSVSSKKLKPYVQDEYILGVQKTLSSSVAFWDNWTLGAKATYRKLRNSIDDTCNSQAMYQVAVEHGLGDVWDDQYGEWGVPDGMPGCWIFNPGSALELHTSLDGTSTKYDITIPGNQLGPRAKRSYMGMVLSAEKTTEKYYFNLSYTWSRNYGNTEGLVKSNNGQDDTGTTADFDFPQIMQGANGYLPNDRRHAFKLYGAYKFTPEWSAGVNVLVQSGTPISCYGGGGGTLDTHFGYSGQWHVCNGQVQPEGGEGRTPWTWTVSPNLTYTPSWAKGLSMQLSVINLFNNDKPVFVYEQSESISNGGSVTKLTNYKLPKYFNTPRYARFQVQYDFNL